MPITVKCTCGKTLQAPNTAVGKKIRCPDCQAAVLVGPPAADPPAGKNGNAAAKDPGKKPADKPKSSSRKKGLLVALGCAAFALMGCVVCGGVGGFFAFRGLNTLSLADRLNGKWEVDVEASKQLRPDFGQPMGFFLTFAKDGTCGFGIPGQELSTKWELKGQVPEGNEIFFRGLKDNHLVAIRKIKILDDDHIEVVQSAYCGNCRMKRTGAASLARADDGAKPGDGKSADGKTADSSKPQPRKGPSPGAPLELPAHTGKVLGVKQNLEGLLITGGADGAIKIWDRESWTVKKERRVNKGSGLTAFDVFANGDTVVFGTGREGGAGGGTIYKWRWSQNDKPDVLSVAKKAPRAVAASHDGMFAAWDDDDWIVVHDLRANKEKIHLTGLFPDLQSLSMQPDATQIVTVAPKGVQLWYTHPNAKPPTVAHNIPSATCAVFVGQGLLVGTSDSKAVVWDLGKKQAIKEMPLPGPARRAALSIDGRRAAIAAGKAVVMFDTGGPAAQLGTVPMPASHSPTWLSLDRFGHRLATAGDEADGKVWVWDITTVK